MVELDVALNKLFLFSPSCTISFAAGQISLIFIWLSPQECVLTLKCARSNTNATLFTALQKLRPQLLWVSSVLLTKLPVHYVYARKLTMNWMHFFLSLSILQPHLKNTAVQRVAVIGRQGLIAEEVTSVQTQVTWVWIDILPGREKKQRYADIVYANAKVQILIFIQFIQLKGESFSPWHWRYFILDIFKYQTWHVTVSAALQKKTQTNMLLLLCFLCPTVLQVQEHRQVYQNPTQGSQAVPEQRLTELKNNYSPDRAALRDKAVGSGTHGSQTKPWCQCRKIPGETREVGTQTADCG